ncbi:MAG: ATP-binding protein [Verrucomicrobiota bacterium]
MDDPLLQRLRQCQDQLLSLQNAVDTAEVGYWSWTADEPMKWDSSMLALFGIEMDKIPKTLDDFLMLLREGSQEAAMDAFQKVQDENKEIDLVLHPEKGNRTVRLTGRAYLSPGVAKPVVSGLCQTIDTRELTSEGHSELANFASVASHDLREPLRMITGYLRLLQERSPEALDDCAKRYIDYACEGADRMRRLIEDLLSYARMEKENIDPVPIALTNVLSEATSNLSTTIRELAAEVAIDTDCTPVVLGDSISLIRLFQNLIGNAIKFHAEGVKPQVQVGFKDGAEAGVPESWITSVKDEGIGIDSDHHELIFNLFQRLNTHDEFEGSGIGLAVCKKIVERHGGSISLESEKAGGSTFYICLPKVNKEAATNKI